MKELRLKMESEKESHSKLALEMEKMKLEYEENMKRIEARTVEKSMVEAALRIEEQINPELDQRGEKVQKTQEQLDALAK